MGDSGGFGTQLALLKPNFELQPHLVQEQDVFLFFFWRILQPSLTMNAHILASFPNLPKKKTPPP